MATARQIAIYGLHKKVCQGNGHSQTQLLFRSVEGTIQDVPQSQNAHMSELAPRSSDNPGMTSVMTWMTWVPRRLMGISDAAGDVAAARAAIFRNVGQCPAIDDNYAPLNVTDEMFGVDPLGKRFRVENPTLSPDGSFWTFEIVRTR